MGNAARKARKRAGETFVREPKVGTPYAERHISLVTDKNFRSHPSNRRLVKLAKLVDLTEGKSK